MATTLKKLNINNQVDLDMFLTELNVCDQSGILATTLRVMVTANMIKRHDEGKKPYGPDDFVPIPAEFIKFIKDWRDGLKKALSNSENLLKLIEEGSI